MSLDKSTSSNTSGNCAQNNSLAGRTFSKHHFSRTKQNKSQSIFNCSTVTNTLFKLDTKQGFSEKDLAFIEKHMGKGLGHRSDNLGLNDTLASYFKKTVSELSAAKEAKKRPRKNKKHSK